MVERNAMATPLTVMRGGNAPEPEHTQCAWCEQTFRSGTGFGVFCSKVCCKEEGEQGTGMGLRTRREVLGEKMVDAMDGRRTLTDQLLVSIIKAQTARIERLERKVAGLEGREVV